MCSKKTTIVLSIIYSMVILLTILVFGILTNTTTEDDIFGDSLNLKISLIFLVPIFITETEIFYNLFYFVNTQNKKTYKTVCNIISLALSIFTAFLLFIVTKTIYFKTVEIGILFSGGLYLSVRVLCFILHLKNN